MKHFFTFFSVRTLAVVVAMMLGACSSDESAPTPSIPTYGMNWSADSKDAVDAAPYHMVSNGNLLLTGSYIDSNKDSYTITLNVPAAVGTYNLSGGTTTMQAASYQTVIGNTTTTYTASSSLGTGSGTITISTLTTTDLAGTFNFTAVSTSSSSTKKTVGNGKFTIKR